MELYKSSILRQERKSNNKSNINILSKTSINTNL